jgi:dTDP-4-dehydrorhamnose reductase
VHVLVTGAGGQLGHDLAAAFSGSVPPGGRRRALRGPEGPARASVEVTAADHASLAVEDRTSVLEAVGALRPDVIVHAAAWTAVDACEIDPDRAFLVNALGTRHVAEAAEATGAHLVYVSTDYVFDGTAARPYMEWDEPNPLSVYGRSKLAGERECRPATTIVRTSWVCGVAGPNMAKTVLRLAAGSGPLRFVDDQHGCPTFTADLAAAVVTLALDRRPGIHHVTNQGATTWFHFARAVLEAAGDDPERVEPIATAELDPPRPAARPANSVLDNAALRLGGLPLLPDWHDGLQRLVEALGHPPRPGQVVASPKAGAAGG